MAQGVVSTAGFTTVHRELERRSLSPRKKANFTRSVDHKISGELVVGTTKGEHGNIRVNADSVLLVGRHAGPQTHKAANEFTSVEDAAQREILQLFFVVISDDVDDTIRNEDVDLKLEFLSWLTAHGSRAL